MISRVRAGASLIALYATSLPGVADAFICRATPATYLAVDSSGGVFVGVNDVGIMAVCSLSTTVGGATPQACASWYSAMLTFRTTGKTALLHYNGSDGATACSSYKNWEIHVPYFVLFD